MITIKAKQTCGKLIVRCLGFTHNLFSSNMFGKPFTLHAVYLMSREERPPLHICCCPCCFFHGWRSIGWWHCHLQNSRVSHCNWAMHIHQRPPLCSLQSGYPCHTVPSLSLSQWPLHPGVSLLLGCTFLTELSWPLPVLRLSDSPSPLHAFKTGTAWEILTLWSSTTSMKCSIYCLCPTAPM